MSAPFKGASRSLGIELYRGSMAYLSEINRAGGVHGRTIALKAHDDGYQPDQAIKNTVKLMLEDQGLPALRLCGHAHRDPGPAAPEEIRQPALPPLLSLYRRATAA